MSDRDLTCKNCGKEIEGLGWVHVDTQYGRCDIPSEGRGLQYAEPVSAAPVEPPVPGKEKTRHSPEGEAEQDAKLLSSKTSLSGVEPPVLSRAAETLVKTKAMVEERLRGAKEREAQESTRLVNGNLDIRALEAVLESLSQEVGDD